MKALTLRPPWGTLVINGIPGPHGKLIFKDVENRDWRTSFRGERIIIHQGRKWDQCAEEWLIENQLGNPCAVWKLNKAVPIGVLLGTAELVACVEASKSPWFVGRYGFVLRNPMPLDKPVPWRGQPGFFEVKDFIQE